MACCGPNRLFQNLIQTKTCKKACPACQNNIFSYVSSASRTAAERDLSTIRANYGSPYRKGNNRYTGGSPKTRASGPMARSNIVLLLADADAESTRRRRKASKR